MTEIDCFGNLTGITLLYSYMLLLNVGFTFFLFCSHKELNNKYIRTISYINYLQKTLNECVNKESEESGSEESGSEIINEGYCSLREASNKVKNWVYNEY